MKADPIKAYNQSDATDFIRSNALRLKVAVKAAKQPLWIIAKAAGDSCR